MKLSCLGYLTCVDCKKGDLFAKVDKEDGGEVLEGTLTCSCGASYPILGGVPRILPKSLLVSVLAEYRKLGSSASKQEADSKTRSIQQATMNAFGFEWRNYADYDADNYEKWMPDGFNAKTGFRDKIGLEVGCGAGRHAERTAASARIHFAVDLSYAVDSAFQRTRHLPNCHVIQADAFNLPFKEHGFDYVYCLGVLQHMHNPPEGFKHLAKQVREGGILLVNVYQASRPVSTALLEAFRKITIKLPARLLNAICFAAGTIDYLICMTWRAIEMIGLGKVLGPVVPERTKEYAKHTYKTVVADWYDRLACPVKIHYKKEDLSGWYEQAGYKDIRVTPYWKAFWNGYGVKA